MVKRVSFFVTIFTVCIFAENIADVAETKQVATEAEAVPSAETVEAAPAVEAEAVEAEQVAAEAEAAPVAETPVVATAPAPVATEPAKEAIIDNPLEFAIVTVVFIATVLLITLTGN